MSNEEKTEDQFRIDARAANKKMSDLKAILLLKQPFYGVLLSMTDFIPEATIPTMATDGVRIFFNPKYVLELSDDERKGVLMHEISHCIYLHCTPKRRLNRDPKRWNVATDFVVNLELKDMKYTLPANVLLDEKYRNMNAEQTYDALPKDISDMETLDTHMNSADEEWDDMEDRVISAYEMTKDFYADKNHGNLPGGITRWVDKMRKSKVKWERIFHKYVGQALAKDDYTYERCNRRLLSQDIYLPDLRNHIIGNVVVAVDTSGSITKKIIETFAAELYKVSHLVEEVTVITCDATVHEVVKIRKMDDFMKKIKFLGGGGTDFRPAFRTIEDMRARPELFIYLTDLYGTFPDKVPPYPVLWVAICEGNVDAVPFGQVTVMPEDKAGATSW